jgi:hypothetical protein
MYKLIGIMFLSAIIYLIVPVSKSEAQSECYKNTSGNTTCRDSYGNKSERYKDNDGNDKTRYPNGSTQTCYWSTSGTYVCR